VPNVKTREVWKMLNLIDVKRHPDGIKHHGLLSFANKDIPCCLGRSGITAQKKEGDGATPIGTFRLLYGFFRKDRLNRPITQLPISHICKEDGWCDEASSPNYNTLVTLPFNHSHEKMMRDDRLYDICIVLDYNINPKTRYRGSAIFFHLTSSQRKPTEGCVAIDPEDMRLLLPFIDNKTRMRIHG
jgi:L,D-peptidoglycan transpeptidase YkuD (ErfK/YbiS/YcfS/YnhG family)